MTPLTIDAPVRQASRAKRFVVYQCIKPKTEA